MDNKNKTLTMRFKDLNKVLEMLQFFQDQDPNNKMLAELIEKVLNLDINEHTLSQIFGWAKQMEGVFQADLEQSLSEYETALHEFEEAQEKAEKNLHRIEKEIDQHLKK